MRTGNIGNTLHGGPVTLNVLQTPEPDRNPSGTIYHVVAFGIITVIAITLIPRMLKDRHLGWLGLRPGPFPRLW